MYNIKFLLAFVLIVHNVIAMQTTNLANLRMLQAANTISLGCISAISAYRASQIHENTVCMYKEKDSDYLFRHSGVLFRTLEYTFLCVASASGSLLCGAMACNCCQRDGLNIDEDDSDGSNDSDNGDDDDDRLSTGHKHEN